MQSLSVLLFISIQLVSGQATNAVAVESIRWHADGPLLAPGPVEAFDEVAVKDPSIVCHDGRWHLFYTARSRSNYAIGYVGADSLDALSGQPRQRLARLRGDASDYAAAPQVFFFRPQKKWYLVFQTDDKNYQAAFSTNEDIGQPDAWSPPRLLVEETGAAKWIDFWVICDESTAYLFYTQNHKAVWTMTTPIERFPEGFANPREVFSPVHESVHVYRVEGRNEYHMLYETRNQDDSRRFGLARSTSLSGPWQQVTERFAEGDQLTFSDPGAHWTDEVSHGEILRTGFDQRLEYAPDHTRILIQGLPRAQHTGAYPSLPWVLGTIARQ